MVTLTSDHQILNLPDLKKCPAVLLLPSLFHDASVYFFAFAQKSALFYVSAVSTANDAVWLRPWCSDYMTEVQSW